VETQSCMISTKIKKNTTDAAQCRFAFVVETQSCMISTTIKKQHHDRCGPMSLCFRYGNTTMHDFYEG
jgi:hypothetical protein